MACSSCDGYQLVPGVDGILIRCADCLVVREHCPSHGCGLVGGRCPSCGREASVAIDLFDRARALVVQPTVPGVLL